ncbi:helix-turn-helix transcriptional regulator [Paenibacillus oceani]|uniref:YafY family transcriptional regulator n=1 Tax=Paenibacillus oceani TaxID=2772510 RepID=A0A927C8Z8_9BACL|nr:YafY family protein [Paenibacillus oceani]MBD2862222.1 YafY family transcriptional regulator [Paenibacillus oceani]
MKRADRLMAILIALQQRPETAQSLADKFEVSKRTVLRDMQSLSEIGIPLYSMTGPSGGFRMMEGFRLSPLQLDSQEALTVLFALRAMTNIMETPFNQARWTVLDKIRSVLPEETLKQVEPLLDRMELEVPVRKTKTPHLSALLEHTAESRWVHVLYRSENHHRRLRLYPRKIYTAHGFWYCEAFSPLHKEVRNFRVDRIEELEVIAQPDEGGNEQLQRAEDEEAPAKPAVRIAAKLTYRGALLAEQDYHIGEHVKQIADDEWTVEFDCPASEWDWAVRFFFTLGMQANVLEPDELRAGIREMAGQLYERYKPDSERNSL